jgi:lambda repressor-like predicted transcriptional regulator
MKASKAPIEGEIRKRFDQHLLTLKLHEPTLKMHEEVSASSRQIYAEYATGGPQRSDLHLRLIDSELGILEKYLGVVDRLSREVWQVQGNTITPEFIRAIPHMLILDIIEARAGSIKHGIEMHNLRTRQGQDVTPSLHHLRQTIEQLKGTVLNRYEAEARTLDYQHLNSKVDRAERNGETITKTDIWRKFHGEFQALAQEEQSKGAAQRDRFIRAYCTYEQHPEVLHVRKEGQGAFALSNSDGPIEPVFGYFCLLKTPECGLWTLSEGISENFQEQFRTLASRAGLALGPSNGVVPEDVWLHKLFLDLLENKSDQLFAATQKGGVIHRVCVASATFCSRLERKSLESETGGEMRDQDMESVWKAEIEVLERRLDDWADKSRPEFRRMVERKQLLQRELNTLLEANRLRSQAAMAAKGLHNTTGGEREAFVTAILARKGWSILDCANESGLDFHTVNGYLKGKTKPYRSTRKKMAEALGVAVDDLPK